MGNTCSGSFAVKNNQSFNKPEPKSNSKQNPSFPQSNNSSNPQNRASKKKPNSNSNSNPNFDSSPKSLLKETTMNRHGANQPYFVLGHKTANIRDIYTLGQKLGQGQFGTTYLCTENSTGTNYACKSIAKRKLISKEDVEDVRREIQIMHHLAGHDNIVTIKGAYEDALYVHIVMELCNGRELFDRIIQRGQYTERKAAEFTKIIVGVVEVCHSLGVMHRDLKPENFLLVNKDNDFSVKAIDFGLSIFFEPGEVNKRIYGVNS